MPSTPRNTGLAQFVTTQLSAQFQVQHFNDTNCVLGSVQPEDIQAGYGTEPLWTTMFGPAWVPSITGVPHLGCLIGSGFSLLGDHI